jgi:hypothetical protein
MRFMQTKIVYGLTRETLENELNRVLKILAQRDCPIKDIKFFLTTEGQQSMLNAAVTYEEEV